MVGVAGMAGKSEMGESSKTSETFKVGIVGASGYTGVELMRLIAGHPQMELVVATGDSRAGEPVADLYPSLAAAYGDRVYDTYEVDALSGLDLVFCGLPHGVSMSVVPEILGTVGHVVDLGSDFRLRDASLYPQWYGADHDCPELLADAAYGLPELFRSEIQGATLIAATGCNAATATLTLAPLLANGLVEANGLVVDLKTGVSGAGRPPKPHTTFCTVDENVTAYGVLTHRHTPEIEQALAESTGTNPSVLFTPHLVPMNRGILATCYGRPTDTGETLDTESLLDVFADYYQHEPFMVVSERLPSTKATLGANTVHLTVRRDPRTGLIMAMGAMDNLMKGAAGMAVQCANLAVGIPEATGLSTVGVYP